MNTTTQEQLFSIDEIGDRIKKIRQTIKKSQKNFAEDLGLSQSHISNIEKGNDKPSLTLIKLICLKYEISEEWLLYGQGSMNPYATWDLSDDGLYAKYASFKKVAEELIKGLSGEDRKHFVGSYCFFLTVVDGIKLDGERKSEYIKLMYDFMDNLEKIMFATTSYKDIFLTKKVNYHTFFDYISTCYKRMERMDKSLKDILNIYLSLFDLPYNF